MTLQAELADEAATQRFGAVLAAALVPGDLVTLVGEVGAGKSTLARAVIRAVAADPGLDVPSPTFTLVQGYENGRLPLLHCDLYRLADPGEVDELGIIDALEDGAVLVEWPDRGDLPPATLGITLAETRGGHSRTVALDGSDEALARVRRSMQIASFLAANDLATTERRPFAADASVRRYESVQSKDGPLILMDAPRLADGPSLPDGRSYNVVARRAETVAPFIAIGEMLRTKGFAAPAIIASDIDRGLVLLEDLGRASIVDGDGRPDPGRYSSTVRVLAAIHDTDWPDAFAVPGREPHVVPPFDRDLAMLEVSQTPAWAFTRFVGRPASEDERLEFEAGWHEALDAIADAERSLVLRDVQSTNVIWRDHHRGVARVGLIDYQDALVGPAAYDVASLAQDARVMIPQEMGAELLEAYRSARTAPPDPLFDTAYAVMAAQRATKLLGLWVRLDERDGKPEYLRHMPRTIDYLSRNLAHPALARVRRWFEAHELLSRAILRKEAA